MSALFLSGYKDTISRERDRDRGGGGSIMPWDIFHLMPPGRQKENGSFEDTYVLEKYINDF